MKKNKITFIVLITIALTTSCGEDLLDVENEKEYDAKTFYESPNSYTEAATAMYTPLLFSGMYSRDWYYTFDLLGNDAEKNFPLQGDLLEFPNYTHTPNNPTINNIWRACYRMVVRSLLVKDLMEKWETSKPEEIALRQRINGEALFMKSLGNFWLVTLWGDVPQRQSINDIELHKPRVAAEEVWKTIEEDLTNAIDLLPVSYSDTKDLGRATKGAAVALLGKAHLYQKEYTEAIAQFEQLTQAPFSYGLEANYDDLFVYDKSVNKETIFAVMHGEWQGWGVGHAYYMFDRGAETWGGRATHTGRAMEYGFNGGDWFNVLVSNALVNSYKYADESGNPYIDPRAANVFYGDPASGGDTEFCDDCEDGVLPYDAAAKGYSWRKYEYYEFEEKHGVPHSAINSQIIRYADVLLMLAECYIETNQTASALPLINQVRVRSNAFLYTTLGDKEQATSILRRERQMELAGEQHRFFDLVRWGILPQTINPEKQAAVGIQPVREIHTKLPIPQPERDANPKVATQITENWN